MLMEHLVQDAAWLNRRLDVPRPSEFVAESATGLLYLVRRYCAKLLYELELHAGRRPAAAADALRRDPRRRAEDRAEPDRLPRATSTPASTSTEYLRAWAFEAQLQRFFREKFGNDVVRAARRRLAAARALVGGAAADGRRAAEGSDRRRDRARGGRRVRARRPRCCVTSSDRLELVTAFRPTKRDVRL